MLTQNSVSCQENALFLPVIVSKDGFSRSRIREKMGVRYEWTD